jgi:cellobiose phosphorylase
VNVPVIIDERHVIGWNVQERMKTTYGHFEGEGAEFTITDPQTPRAFDNFLWNDSVYSNVQQTGVGCCDYQVDGTEGIQMFTGVGRICDFDVFGRDHLMNRLIYVRDNESGGFWNINWEPVRHAYESYACTHGPGHTTIRTAVGGIEAEFRIFVPCGRDPVELWTIRLKNASGRHRSLSVFAYNQFQFKYKWGFDSYGDMIFRGVWMNRDLNAVVASKHPFRKPHSHLIGFMTSDRSITAFDGSRDAFVGIYNNLACPQAVERGRCSNTPGSSEATIGAAQFDFELPSGEVSGFSLIVGATDQESKIGGLRDRYLGSVEDCFQALLDEKKALENRNRVSTPDRHFDRMANTWTKQGALYGAAWCRWGWNGFRDIVQHGLGVASIKPERTREILLAAFRHQYRSGVAMRGWNPVDEKAYSDSALWLVFTLVAYLKETGEFALLDEDVPFYDGGNDSVLGHIRRALDFLENNRGAHGLCLIKFGDWNDSLTGVGKEGRGESVWLSQACAEALRLMSEMMRHLGRPAEESEYSSRRERLIDAINSQAWDGDWYARCFDDDGKPLGSRENEFARIFMETQSWALISGAADAERARRLIASCDKILGTPIGYLLLAPSYQREDASIGRISCLEPGICENGTVYSHLNIWMMLGLLRYGMGDKAYEVFKRITPGYVDGDMSLKQKCPPYMYSNCYFGPEHRNNSFQMEFTWITGSLAWFNTVPVQEMLGVRPDYDGLVIQPCLPSAWEHCEVGRSFRGADYRIEIRNPLRLQSGTVTLTLDGHPVAGNRLPVPQPGSRHEVVATLA